MMSIDWSKAPEGATHYDCRPHAAPAFMQRTLDDPQRWNYWNRDGELIYYGFIPDHQVALMAEKPAEWTGEGLPPVRTACEFAMHDGGDWEEVQVIAHHNGYAVIAIASTDGFNVEVAECHELRPIRTAEQIVADQREKAIDEMVRTALHQSYVITPAQAKIVFERLYDAGYRKQVNP